MVTKLNILPVHTESQPPEKPTEPLPSFSQLIKSLEKDYLLYPRPDGDNILFFPLTGKCIDLTIKERSNDTSS